MTREYASVWTRLGALVIDGLLSALFYIPFYIAVAIRGYGYDGGMSAAQGATFMLLTLGSLAFWFWNAVYRMGTTGQSLGRQFLDITVLDGVGRPIGIGRALLRETIGRFLSGIVCYIGYLNAFWDKRKQMWHDKLSDCYVFYVEKNPPLPPSQGNPSA